MFLTKMPNAESPAFLEKLVTSLPQPAAPLHSRRPDVLALPASIICFQRQHFAELNHPRRGRALHHRFVLIFALHQAVTVFVDDRELVVEGGSGLLIFPFQFHHYVRMDSEKLCWLFITFEHAGTGELEPLRFRTFAITSEMRSLLSELIVSYNTPPRTELPVLLLAVLLARLRLAKPTKSISSGTPGSLLGQVNLLAQHNPAELGVKEISRSLGISPSHLRTRFRASCGVSLGRHLRRLRLEKACGLLRLTPNRISEISEQCGFNSIYSFSRTFRVAYGVSPLAYRQGIKAPKKAN